MGRFVFQQMTLGGAPFGEPVEVKTLTGLLLQCPANISESHVAHMAAIARQTPNYPCDLSVWEGDEGNQTMRWTARIYWRE